MQFKQQGAENTHFFEKMMTSEMERAQTSVNDFSNCPKSKAISQTLWYGDQRVRGTACSSQRDLLSRQIPESEHLICKAHNYALRTAS